MLRISCMAAFSRIILLLLVGNIVYSSAYALGDIADGYTNHLSVYPGDSITLYLNAYQTTPGYTIKLYTLQGQEVLQCQATVSPQLSDSKNTYEDGFGYKRTTTVYLPPTLKSGVYLWENKIPMIVKSSTAKIIVLYPSNTENAYCNSGGKSLYSFNSSDKAASPIVSFLRPMSIEPHSMEFLRWMEQQDFQNVGYITDMDMDEYREIKRASLLIITGHSEYWTLQARKNFDRFVGDGKNVLVLSGNTMWWQVRYSKDRNQLICYKNADKDPIKSTKLKTINWNEITLNYPILRSLGTDFTLAGYGRKADKGWDGYKVIASRSPLLEGTKLKDGDILSCASDELDGAPLSGFENGIPIINQEALGFQKVEIIGYDHVARGGVDGVATWIVFKANRSSGIVINTASTDWCSRHGIGSNPDIQTITRTMITRLLNHEYVFSPETSKEPASFAN
ncbi:MAG TPA: N,N-dimethylformamidase beta subunit family domain-containing protein [Ohtaekwangia sp.]|uniref:N,N-dimethylformamidase beta subunit family domain-containing protein n=1 Tax=Ohtaekwangia sp. TaxID=2066019 RepID=UPI002F947710